MVEKCSLHQMEYAISDGAYETSSFKCACGNTSKVMANAERWTRTRCPLRVYTLIVSCVCSIVLFSCTHLSPGCHVSK